MEIDIKEIAGLEDQVRNEQRYSFLNEPGEYLCVVERVYTKKSFKTKENLTFVDFEVLSSTNPSIPNGVKRAQCMRMDNFDYGKKDLVQFSMTVRDALKDTDNAIDNLETVISGVLGEGLAAGLNLHLQATEFTSNNGVEVTKYNWSVPR